MKIAVAMSGGVDSSVVAKMLKDEGHELVGLFLKLWNDPTCNVAKENRCCNYEALEDARKVAHGLNIPFYVINAVDEFKKEVVDYFVDEYKKLNTPNPCIVCNEKIKFDLLMKKALSIGCDHLATGHYARIEDSGNSKSETLNFRQIPNSKSQIANKQECHSREDGNLLLVDPRVISLGESEPRRKAEDDSIDEELETKNYKLKTGIDSTKDQSYMLYRLNQDQLSKTLFPLGEMTKKDVRALAVKWDLPVKEKPESQEICFFGDRDYRSFLKRYLDEKYFKPGEIVDKEGNVLGKHEGLINYTIGQRKGIEQISNNKFQISNKNSNVIASAAKQSLESKQPLYVIGFDVEKNRLIVGADEAIYSREMTVTNLSWINSSFCHPECSEGSLKVKIRYRHSAVPCKIAVDNNEAIKQLNNMHVVFDEPQRAITPGQSAVFYSGEKVIGGGIIQ